MSHHHKAFEDISQATGNMAGARASDHERLLPEDNHVETVNRPTFETSAGGDGCRLLAEMIMDFECERHAIQGELERLRLLQQAARS